MRTTMPAALPKNLFCDVVFDYWTFLPQQWKEHDVGRCDFGNFLSGGVFFLISQTPG
ncbi:unnamed protein product [Haemonchus placei]|uniref:Uncharacterized protein n=1 Tax=Haemonchus placei TaxID=6290 RepID=A0A0N4WBB3_HAEPC|nr:unnamed protein product [Haemonchus placei]